MLDDGDDYWMLEGMNGDCKLEGLDVEWFLATRDVYWMLEGVDRH